MQLISPNAAVFEMAPAKVLHGAVRLQRLTSSPTPETHVRVACAAAGSVFAISKQPAMLSLRQQLTRVTGSLHVDGKEIPLEDAKLRGDQLSFRLAGRKGQFTGRVSGSSIEGTLDGKAPWSAMLGG